MKKLLSALAGTSVGALTVAVVGPGSAPAQMSSGTESLPAARCIALRNQQIGGAAVTKAEFVASGATLPPFADKMDAAFCRVEAVAAPVAGSSIRLQMWLPVRWNGKLLGVGGGGFEGGFASAPLGLRAPVSAGYAAIATDAGHSVSTEPSWAIGHAEKVVDFGYRANHIGAVFGKALVTRFYEAPVKQAYFQGCSNGGRDALMLAQRHPEDYNAIIAGAPANGFTGLMASFVRAGRLSQMAGVELTSTKLKLVHDAAVAQCDLLDGVRDGLIGAPPACHFNPAVLQCRAGSSTGCLSRAEVGAVNAIYRGVRTRDGRQVTPGLAVGSEYNWAEWLTTPKALGVGMGRQFYSNFVYGDPSWTPDRFNLDADVAAARARVSPTIDALDPDLRPFLRRGGKLLMYHGWDDAAIPALNSIQYFTTMRRTSGSAALGQTRLFMLPGVSHCTGGNGPSAVDYLGALDRWSETGAAPERLSATKPESVYRAMAGLPSKTLRTGVICAWPKIARYSGRGTTENPANYTCR